MTDPFTLSEQIRSLMRRAKQQAETYPAKQRFQVWNEQLTTGLLNIIENEVERRNQKLATRVRELESELRQGRLF